MITIVRTATRDGWRDAAERGIRRAEAAEREAAESRRDAQEAWRSVNYWKGVTEGQFASHRMRTDMMRAALAALRENAGRPLIVREGQVDRIDAAWLALCEAWDQHGELSPATREADATLTAVVRECTHDEISAWAIRSYERDDQAKEAAVSNG